MAINISHRKTVGMPSSGDNTRIQQNNWNDTHALTMLGPRLIGKPTEGNGPAVEITLGSNLSFSGNTLNADISPVGAFVPLTRTLTAGSGLKGGGDLTANRSFAVDDTVVRTTGDQDIAGTKNYTGSLRSEGTLSSHEVVTVDRTINGASLGNNLVLSVNHDVLRTHGDQNIGGDKNFNHNLLNHGKHVAAVETTNWDNATNFPIGHTIYAYGGNANRNHSSNVFWNGNNERRYLAQHIVAERQLAGVWRARGHSGGTTGVTLFQRMA